MGDGEACFKLKVLRIIPSLDVDLGGPSVSSLLSCLATQRLGIQNHVLVPVCAEKAELSALGRQRLRDAGVVVTELQIPRFLGERGRRWAIAPVLLTKLTPSFLRSFDIVHCHTAWVFSTIIAVWRARSAGVPVVLTPHETLTTFDQKISKTPMHAFLKRRLREFLVRRLQKVIFSSPLELADSKTALATEQLSYAFHPVFDEESATPSIDRQPSVDRFRIGFLGRVHPKKRLDLIIDALPRTSSGVCLVIGGTGPDSILAKFFDQANRAGVSDRLEWRGFLTQKDKPGFFASIDALVMPSDYECFGMAAAEALTYGIPVLISDRTGVSQFIRDAGAGSVVAQDASSIALGIESLRAQVPEYRSLRHRAFECARAGFSFAAHGKKLYEIYSALVDARSH